MVGLASGVVDRVEESVVALEARSGQPSQVGRALRGIDHRGERRGVGRHHQLVAQPALQTEPRDAEGLVLIGVVSVDDVVRGLRDAPRHSARGGVLHLAAHDHPTRFVEQRVRIASHDEQRHQILEHRGAPRQQDRRAADTGDGSSQMEPVGFGDVALGDREKARQPRFGGQQVVVRRIATTRPLVVRETIADGEQLPLRVVEESEVHAIEQGDGPTGQMVEMQPLQRHRQRQERAREVSAVDRRDIGRRKRRQRARVVPVQQVTLEAFQAFDGRERGLDPVEPARRCR